MRYEHRVEKISLNSTSSAVVTAAGNGTRGPSQDQLSEPWGIFVDIELNLFIADSSNNRIQKFRPGQSMGETVAGNGTPNGLQLSYPTDVVMDGDGYLYIADNENHRVIRSGNDSYACLVGCNRSGSAVDPLNKVYAVRLDSGGNLYVVDEYNNRIQRFQLIDPACSKFTKKLQRPVKDSFFEFLDRLPADRYDCWPVRSNTLKVVVEDVSERFTERSQAYWKSSIERSCFFDRSEWLWRNLFCLILRCG